MHGLRQRLSERRFVFRFWETDASRSEIERDQKELLCHMVRRNRRRGCVSGKFPGCPGGLRTRPILDGPWLRDDHNVSHSENMEII